MRERAQQSAWSAGQPGIELVPYQELVAEIERLRIEVQVLRNALATSSEHGDSLQEHIYRLSQTVAAEVHERQASEHKMRKLVDAITREKADLEILVQILIEEGDQSALEGEKARIDGLTRIANRRRFDEYLGQQWERHLAVQHPLSLLICDVDHFKRFNDRYGHQAGDECLATVARAITHCLRADDLVARYGGEEFAVVLPHTDHAAALAVAERARLAVTEAVVPNAASAGSEPLTISIGVACAKPRPGDPASARALVDEADRNLYLAKNRGRNRVEPGAVLHE